MRCNHRTLTRSLLGLGVSCLLTLPASAGNVSDQVSIYFENSLIIGSGKHVNVHRVPVKVGNKISYYDLTFDFTLQNGGNLAMTSANLAVAAKAPQGNIIPGIYQDVSGLCYRVKNPISMPGTNNRKLYIIESTDSDERCDDDARLLTFSAQLISGSPENHPDIGHKAIVSSLPNSYEYGQIATRVPSSLGAGIDSNWHASAIFGVRQAGGRTLVFATFTDRFGTDHENALESTVMTRLE